MSWLLLKIAQQAFAKSELSNQVIRIRVLLTQQLGSVDIDTVL